MALAAPLDELADRCSVAVDVIRDVARRFATAARGMCITHTGVSHTPTGTIAEWLATVLNALTNRLDQPGGKRTEPGYIALIAIWSQFAPRGKHRPRQLAPQPVPGSNSRTETIAHDNH